MKKSYALFLSLCSVALASIHGFPFSLVYYFAIHEDAVADRAAKVDCLVQVLVSAPCWGQALLPNVEKLGDDGLLPVLYHGVHPCSDVCLREVGFNWHGEIF